MSRAADRITALTKLGLSLALALLGGLAACSHDSYLVLTLKSSGMPLASVTSISVAVASASGQPMVTRTFTVGGSSGLSIDATTGKTLSVSFTPDHSGIISVKVTVATLIATVCATGSTSATIKQGAVTNASVTLSATTCAAADAGAPDGSSTFSGCDPAVVGSCPAPQTCYVDCANEMGRCVPGGTKGAGETCASNNDCAPGTQCFDFGCATTTRACLRFCNGDDACGTLTNSAGASTCRDPVFCPAMTTYKTCSFACDPRGAATTGCPAGLECFLFMDTASGQDTPSCGCPAATRIGIDGSACARSADCAPGFLCDLMAGGQFCRKLCKMSAPADCGAGQTCQMLTNNPTFGVCISGLP